MNWEALEAIRETLGTVAVFVTLAYLAVEAGHARREGQRAGKSAANGRLSAYAR